MLFRAVAVIALLSVGCASATEALTPTGTAAHLDSEQIANGVAVADADMYANRYAAADATFAMLLSKAPGSAAVHAADALYLNYAGDGVAAHDQAARAIVLDPRDADGQAILCRVDDWAGDLTAAVTAGKRAVALAPTDALAHLFLAESLADSGDVTGARAHIATAQTLIAAHPTAYPSAEVHREQANLDADLGDTAAALVAFEAALGTQPHWLYRTTEVVNADLVAGQTAAARSALDAAVVETPDDLATIESLGDDAMLIADSTAASALWSRALKLAPDDPAVLDANGEIAVAASHDSNSGISDFEAALRVSPHDAEAAAYIEAITTDIDRDPALGHADITAAVLANLSDGPAPRHIPSIPDPATATGVDAALALAAVSAARSAAGLPAVSLDPHLSASALSHSFYWLFNYFAPSVTGLGIHLETAGLPGYAGVYPWTRAPVFGYPNRRVGEDITHSGSPDSAVADWVNSVYHRFAIMRPDLRVIGYGEATVGSVAIEDMEFGFGVAGNAAPVLYPGAGQANVPATFVDNELPDPVPRGNPRTTGYPITVTFSAADRVSMHSFTLTAPGGAALEAYVLTPSAGTENSASLLPVAPLVPGDTYTARISATVDGAAYARTWTFTVAI